ncbi:alpha/beta fold hydrolase [Lelliottia amnigena]|jgi:pimeloyl-ACP methyl ester carboxylesterase|uniref:alpha/beta fold hydrolase n=1 Tax=Lelliottia amnigena TaxID=61646 RepID=UPI001C5C8DCF|nr:alpha/beta hydrolase [Lelliottia amnigena]MCE9966984.1 alpha/beta hydrolase [Lelliottia amnigena]QXZ20576.1 alpha/beta hydrolase [Lelliottia amnigena]
MGIKHDIFFTGILISLSFLLVGCVTDDSRITAKEIAQHSMLSRDDIQTNPFLIATWSRITAPVHSLRVYIEGDGFAWKSRTQPSDDPTPRKPIGLTLAATDKNQNVLYIARPCQFIGPPLPAHCDKRVWTSDRFSPSVIDAMNDALTQFVKQYPGVKLELIGYSGGGNIAAILAERRTDVRSLRTVAGNLDVAYVNAIHHVSAMPDAVSAIDRASALRTMPQLHFSGDADKTVTPEVAQRFQRAVGGTCSQVDIVSNMTHGSDWAAIWPQLLAKELPEC